jgi:hypothetical protein
MDAKIAFAAHAELVPVLAMQMSSSRFVFGHGLSSAAGQRTVHTDFWYRESEPDTQVFQRFQGFVDVAYSDMAARLREGENAGI